MDAFLRLVAVLTRVCGVFAAGLIVLAVAAVCHMILMRSILGQQVIWQTEFVTFSLVAATLVGSPYVLALRGHVNVDLVPLYVGDRARMALAVSGTLLGLAFSAVVLFNGVSWWLEAAEAGWVNDTLWAPKLWVPYLALPVGFAVLCLQFIADLLCLATGRARPFGPPPGAGR